MNDDETVTMLANDPFHKGLEKYGECKFVMDALTDGDVQDSQAKIDRLMKKPKVCRGVAE